jgi:hypothetical protein
MQPDRVGLQADADPHFEFVPASGTAWMNMLFDGQVHQAQIGSVQACRRTFTTDDAGSHNLHASNYVPRRVLLCGQPSPLVWVHSREVLVACFLHRCARRCTNIQHSRGATIQIYVSSRDAFYQTLPSTSSLQFMTFRCLLLPRVKAGIIRSRL